MQVEIKKFLADIQEAVEDIIEFTRDKSIQDYIENPLLRAGVERQFEIIGEALNQLSKIDMTTAERLTDYRRIIAFRNILIHGYSVIDDKVVWDVAKIDIPILLQEVSQLLEEP